MPKYFCGIEGGATHSSVVLINDEGKIVSQLEGEPPSNHWLVGIDKCSDKLVEMIKKAKIHGGLSPEEKLEALGLCLSGCEDEKSNNELKEVMLSKDSNLNDVIVASDTVGPLSAASDRGGIVLISGTGSNCLLVNPDGTQARCGGWSYMIGDEGSAYWIAHKAVQLCVHDQDNFKKAPYNTEYVWNAIRNHFEIQDKFGLLEISYKKFNKSFYAALTKKLSVGAVNGDKLCRFLFELAGEDLAYHILAVSSEVHSSLHEGPFGLPIVCVGSVWKSWSLMAPGFLKVLGLTGGVESKLTKFSLLKLKVCPALGAALLSAQTANIPKKYEEYVESFYSHGLGKEWPVTSSYLNGN